jgi:hypothetical protein
MASNTLARFFSLVALLLVPQPRVDAGKVPVNILETFSCNSQAGNYENGLACRAVSY